jgi:hypothetical protein
MKQIKHKELDRQLEIRIDRTEAEYVGAKIGGATRLISYSLGKIDAYKDIRELYKHLKSCDECWSQKQYCEECSMENL